MKKLTIFMICIVLLALCVFSSDCAQAVQAALELCLYRAVPSLFPFFVVGSLAVSCGLAQACGSLFAPFMRRVFHLPACAAAALALGFLGGYPAGARIAAELYQNGQCSQEEASAIAACCNNTGPAFLIGMCGTGLFHSLHIGIFLYCIHILSALLCAVLFRPSVVPPIRSTSAPEPLPPFVSAFTQSVVGAGRSCLMISAFILFFAVVLCLLQRTGLFALLLLCMEKLSFFTSLSDSGCCGLLTGIFELTQGLALIQPNAGSLCARLTAVSFLCAFGGLSVLCQTAAVADGLCIKKCLLGKCRHALCAALLCRIVAIFPIFSALL